MDEQRLFRLAPAGLSINAYFVHGEGWRLSSRMRRADEPWADTELLTYTHLSTAELLDVICADAATQLGLG